MIFSNKSKQDITNLTGIGCDLSDSSKESDIKLKHILQIMQCQKCENTAVYTRKYSGESLCSECFSNSILRKAAKTISKYKMIKNDELVVVGVSGGKTR